MLIYWRVIDIPNHPIYWIELDQLWDKSSIRKSHKMYQIVLSNDRIHDIKLDNSHE